MTIINLEILNKGNKNFESMSKFLTKSKFGPDVKIKINLL